MRVEFSAAFRRKAGIYVRQLDDDILPALKEIAEISEPHYDDNTRRRIHAERNAEFLRAWNEKAAKEPQQDDEEEEYQWGGERIAPEGGRNSARLQGFYQPQKYETAGEYYVIGRRMRDILQQIQTGDEILTADPWRLGDELKAVCSLAQGMAASSAYYRDTFASLKEWLSDDKEINRRLGEAAALQDHIRSVSVLFRNSPTKSGFGLSEATRAEARQVVELCKRRHEQFEHAPAPVYPEENMACYAHAQQEHCMDRVEQYFQLMALDYHSDGDHMGRILRETVAVARTMAEQYGFLEAFVFVQRHREALREAEHNADMALRDDLRKLRRERGGEGGQQGMEGIG